MFAKTRLNKKILAALVMLVALLLVLSQGIALGQAQPAVRATRASPTAVLAWNTIALRASITVAGQSPAVSPIYLAYVQAAVYDAVVAIEGRYQPYQLHLARRPGASVDAAVAAAAHDVLSHYFPAQQAALAADYARALAAIPDGTAKDEGITVGQAAAAGIIALRQGDGLGANIGFTMPPPDIGVWQLPAGQTPAAPWLSRMRPFMLLSPDQFRPGPPPDLTSSGWATEYNEVKTMGYMTSTVRTAEQTDVARFWTAHGTLQDNLVYQQVVAKRGLDAVQAARLLAMGNLVGADAVIACWDAKYQYLFWRPIFAIRQGAMDGNPATAGDSTWTPLLSTPPHPEYPSGHSCVTAAAAEVLVAFLGTQQIDVDYTSYEPGVQQTTRHFARAHDLVQEMINARVWGGIHYRETDVKGAVLGRKVAHWALQRYFLLERGWIQICGTKDRRFLPIGCTPKR